MEITELGVDDDFGVDIDRRCVNAAEAFEELF